MVASSVYDDRKSAVIGRIATRLIVGILILTSDIVESVINRHMGHTLGAGMYITSKQPFCISDP